ncbi:hypothetical protein DLAC_11816 [Tieghemostelium lacteum]|uniref:Uncharacterized protein n=1 Tax=Tieghemostelium lacteum TaxID=361077 RepID=A0A151Z4M4_TIELA|nr:hypothetical protein DLAC_11816 [Tieghemostelium lacteum]|eukprot:KYQ88910.1 hypothetical protein DLAC_11816 [Tieghemostelium lacteum]
MNVTKFELTNNSIIKTIIVGGIANNGRLLFPINLDFVPDLTIVNRYSLVINENDPIVPTPVIVRSNTVSDNIVFGDIYTTNINILSGENLKLKFTNKSKANFQGQYYFEVVESDNNVVIDNFSLSITFEFIKY